MISIRPTCGSDGAVAFPPVSAADFLLPPSGEAVRPCFLADTCVPTRRGGAPDAESYLSGGLVISAFVLTGIIARKGPARSCSMARRPRGSGHASRLQPAKLRAPMGRKNDLFPSTRGTNGRRAPLLAPRSALWLRLSCRAGRRAQRVADKPSGDADMTLLQDVPVPAKLVSSRSAPAQVERSARGTPLQLENPNG